MTCYDYLLVEPSFKYYLAESGNRQSYSSSGFPPFNQSPVFSIFPFPISEGSSDYHLAHFISQGSSMPPSSYSCFCSSKGLQFITFAIHLLFSAFLTYPYSASLFNSACSTFIVLLISSLVILSTAQHPVVRFLRC